MSVQHTTVVVAIMPPALTAWAAIRAPVRAVIPEMEKHVKVCQHKVVYNFGSLFSENCILHHLQWHSNRGGRTTKVQWPLLRCTPISTKRSYLLFICDVEVCFSNGLE